MSLVKSVDRACELLNIEPAVEERLLEVVRANIDADVRALT